MSEIKIDSRTFCLGVYKYSGRQKKSKHYYIVTKPCKRAKTKFYVDETGKIRSKFRSGGRGNDKCLMKRLVNGGFYLVLQSCDMGPQEEIIVQPSSGEMFLKTADGDKAVTFPTYRSGRPMLNALVALRKPDNDRIGQKWILQNDKDIND